MMRKNLYTLVNFLFFIVLLTVLGWWFHFSFGVIPRTAHGLIGCFAYPFFHENMGHLVGNLIPLTILGSMIILKNERFVDGLFFMIIFSGICVWIFGRNAEHIGASGIVFAFFGYLLASPFIHRPGISGLLKRLFALCFGIIAFFFYWYLLISFFTQGPEVSIEGHFFGFLSGILWVNIEEKIKRN